MKKTKYLINSTIVLLAIVMILSSFSGCTATVTPEKQVDIFRTFAAEIAEYESTRDGSKRENMMENFKKYAEKLDLWYQYTPDRGKNPVLGAEFTTCYLEQYTSEELLCDCVAIYDFMSDHPFRSWARGNMTDDSEYADWHSKEYEECLCSKLSNMLEVTLDAVGMEPLSFDLKADGTAGYYADHPDADPQPYTETTDITVQDGNGGFTTSYKENTWEVEYYGDFAITTVTQWHDGGKYYWHNGEFYDVPSHWEKSVLYQLHCKGIRIYDSESFEQLISPAYKIYSVNDRVFLVGEYSVTWYDAYDNPGPTHQFLHIREITPEE